MNTFSAFRFAARTLLHPTRPSAHFRCLNPIALHPRVHVRFKKNRAHVIRRPRNGDIPYADVSLVHDDNSLTKVSLKSLLNSINHQEEWVELVDEKPEPVVKIIKKRVALKLQKQLKERQREGARKNIVKEMQLTWGSGQGDLEHKLARIREYLAIGAKVDIVFSTKPKTIPPPVKDMQEKVKNTIESLADIAKEWKPVEWRKNMAAIFLQGKAEPTPGQKQVEEDGAGEEEPAAEDEGEGLAEPIIPTTPPPPPPPRSTQPPKAKDFVDLSELGWQPPKGKKNPLSGKREVKKYGKRSSGGLE
ncbi:hypothetical protein B0H19DRAFT_1034171 [Mycena capillaripes]|nr:hypothetical protein B0H19DRAFT_1034171 [Mycena capillaripes]